MNKYQEAITSIRLNNCCKEDFDTLQELIDSTQNKPIFYLGDPNSDSSETCRCPKCDSELDCVHNMHYCGSCGLKLDWSDIIPPKDSAHVLMWGELKDKIRGLNYYHSLGMDSMTESLAGCRICSEILDDMQELEERFLKENNGR